MKKSDKLFELIQSMSMTEKVYFKIYTSTHAKKNEKNYIRLFNVLAAQKEYDEIKIKISLKKNITIKHFSSSKNYLYKIILKFLRAYHSDNNKSPYTKTMEMILDSIFLRDRGLIDQSNKALCNAKDLAMKQEDLFSLLRIHKLQLDNNYKRPNIKLSEIQEKDLFLSIPQIIDRLREEIELDQLRNKLNSLQIKYGENTSNKTAIDEIKNILESPLLKEDEIKYNLRHSFSHVLSLKVEANFIIGNYQELIRLNQLHVISLEKDSLFDTEPIQYKYAGALSNRIYICSRAGMVKEAENAFNKIRGINLSSFQRQLIIHFSAYTNILNAFIASGMKDKALALIPEIMLKLKKIERKLLEEIQLVLFSNIATVFFMDSNYSNSLKWINKALNIKKHIREDVQTEARILNIFIHYELGNFQLLEGLLLSFQRSLLKRNDAFLKAIHCHMKTLLSNQSKREMQKELQSLKLDMESALADETNKYPYIFSWIEEKLKER